MATRNLTTEERNAIRDKNQFSKYYLAIHNPEPIFTCVISALPTSNNKVVQLEYDTVLLGDYTDVIPGMTCWVGTDPGAYDMGKVRVRKSPTDDTLFVGEHSNIKWLEAVGTIYLTVVDEFQLWARHPRLLADSTFYMDYDVEYDSQHEDFLPVVNMGSHVCLWLEGTDVTVVFDASDSWSFKTGSPTYLWECATGAIDDDTASSTNITFDAVGVHRVACTVTIGGVSRTSYRYVFVFSEEAMPFEKIDISSLSGSFENNGWECEITVTEEEADISLIQEGALVILFSRDYYNNQELEIGAQVGRENIKLIGYINGEKIVVNPNEGYAKFSFGSPSEVMKVLMVFTDGIESVHSSPTSFVQMPQMTIDKALWHSLEWRSTCLNVFDWYRTEDTRQISELQTGQGSLWEQLFATLEIILAKGCFDKYGRFFTEVEQQLVPEDERSGFPVIEFTLEDFQEKIDIDNIIKEPTSMVDLSGVFFREGVEPKAYFSLASGNVFDRYGSVLQVEQIALSNSQSETNELAGLLLGWYNHKFEFEITLASNCGMVDLCPRQRISIDIPASETVRGIGYTGNVIIREINYRLNAESADFIVLNGEEETLKQNAVTNIVLDANDEEVDLSFPDFPAFPALPALPILMPVVTTVNPNYPKTVAVATSLGVFYTRTADLLSEAQYFAMNDGLSEEDIESPYKHLVATKSGALWLICGEDFNNNLYRASKLGGTWTLMANGNALAVAHSLNIGKILGIGINPDASESICVALGLQTTLGGTKSFRLAFSSGGALSIASEWNTVGTVRQEGVVYHNGKWYLFYADNDTYLVELNTSGALLNSYLLTTNGSISLQAIPNGDEFIYWDRQSGGTPGFYLVTDSGGTTGINTFAPARVNPQGMVMSPDGVHGMGAGASVYTPYKTTDGGATWQSVGGTIPIGSDIWESCGDSNRFLFGGGLVLRVTLDQGTTYDDIIGNLTVIAPLVDIQGIRYIDG